MSYNAKVIRIFIASPGDVQKERDLIREVINEWNIINSFKYNTVLMPVGWETDSVASFGVPPQEEINLKLLNSCDLLIGVFWSKLGMPTSNYQSGTVEEIEVHSSQGKEIMLFFSKAAIPQKNYNEEQFKKLKVFKESISSRCLYKEYDDSDKFKDLFVKQLYAKLNEDWATEILRTPLVPINANNEIVKINISSWNDKLNLINMSNLISWLTSSVPSMSNQNYQQLEDLIEWILARKWTDTYTHFSDSLFKYRLILRDLLNFISESSDGMNNERIFIEKKYNKCKYTPELHDKLLKEYCFNVALVQDLAIELCRATNFIIDLYRNEIDQLFLIDLGLYSISIGPDENLIYRTLVVQYCKESKSIPYNGIEIFKQDRKNRDICMGKGKDIYDEDFSEWYNR